MPLKIFVVEHLDYIYKRLVDKFDRENGRYLALEKPKDAESRIRNYLTKKDLKGLNSFLERAGWQDEIFHKEYEPLYRYLANKKITIFCHENREYFEDWTFLRDFLHSECLGVPAYETFKEYIEATEKRNRASADNIKDITKKYKINVLYVESGVIHAGFIAEILKELGFDVYLLIPKNVRMELVSEEVIKCLKLGINSRRFEEYVNIFRKQARILEKHGIWRYQRVNLKLYKEIRDKKIREFPLILDIYRKFFGEFFRRNRIDFY